MTKINAIRQQRPDRISLLLNRLEEKGYVKLIDTSSSKAYLVTEKGFEAYLKWIKEFLSFVRTINDDADKNLD